MQQPRFAHLPAAAVSRGNRYTIHMGQAPFQLDIRSLALMRVMLGLIVAWDIARRFSQSWQYLDQGMIAGSQLKFPHFLTPYVFTGASETGVRLLLALTFIAAIMFAAGALTRWVNVLLWLLVIFIQHRNPMLLDGSDVYTRWLLLWSIVLPMGAAYSVDSWWGHRIGKATPDLLAPGLASFGLILQIFTMYFATGISKANPSWTSGLAVSRTLEYLYYPTGFGRALADWHVLLKGATWGTLIMELSLPFLLLVPWRPDVFRIIVIGVFGAMHVGIIFIYDVGMFSWVSLAALAALIPTALWDHLQSYYVPHNFQFRAPEQSRIGLRLTLGLICVLGIVNCNNYLPLKPAALQRGFKQGIEVLRLQQSWTMFHTVTKRVHWPLMIGEDPGGNWYRLPDGREIGGKLNRELLQAEFVNYREKKAYLNVVMDFPYREQALRNLARRNCRRYELTKVMYLVVPYPDIAGKELGKRHVNNVYACPGYAPPDPRRLKK